MDSADQSKFMVSAPGRTVTGTDSKASTVIFISAELSLSEPSITVSLTVYVPGSS